MQKKLESLLEIKKKLKHYLEDKKVYDVILFGSYVKGKTNPGDIDIVVISDETLEEINGFHVSFIKPKEFFVNTPSLINALLREGFSLKKNKSFSQCYGFNNECLFVYELSSLNASLKVQIVKILRGKKFEKGMVEELNGKWLANSVFTCPIEKDYLFESFFVNKRIKFKKSYVLIH